MAIQREMRRAIRRVLSSKGLRAFRKEQLSDRLRQIVSAGLCTASGQRYVLAQNVGSAERPLWLYLCMLREGTGRLVFSGRQRPFEFSEAHAVELAPLLEFFAGEVLFIPTEGIRVSAVHDENVKRAGVNVRITQIGRADMSYAELLACVGDKNTPYLGCLHEYLPVEEKQMNADAAVRSRRQQRRNTAALVEQQAYAAGLISSIVVG